MPPLTAPRREVTPASTYLDAWSERLDARAPQPVDGLGLGHGDVVVVVVAHPDDETLAMGGTVAALATAGVEVHVLALSHGEAALRHLGVAVPGLAERRTRELVAAGRALGAAGVQTFDWPDGELARHETAVTEAVRTTLHDLDADRLLTLWRGDPHPDHRAAATAAVRAAERVGVPVSEHPLWALHWTDPATVADDVRPVECGSRARRRREQALACYASQTRPLRPDLEPVLPAPMLAGHRECVVVAR